MRVALRQHEIHACGAVMLCVVRPPQISTSDRTHTTHARTGPANTSSRSTKPHAKQQAAPQHRAPTNSESSFPSLGDTRVQKYREGTEVGL